MSSILIITSFIFLGIHKTGAFEGVNCVPGDLLGSENCTLFFKCIQGRHFNSIKEFSCPPGTFFSMTSSRCTHDPSDCNNQEASPINPSIDKEKPYVTELPDILGGINNIDLSPPDILQSPPINTEKPQSVNIPPKSTLSSLTSKPPLFNKITSERYQSSTENSLINGPPSIKEQNPLTQDIPTFPHGPAEFPQQFPVIQPGPPDIPRPPSAPPTIITPPLNPSNVHIEHPTISGPPAPPVIPIQQIVQPTDSEEDSGCSKYELDQSSFYKCEKPGFFPSYESCVNFYVCINTMDCIVKGFKVECPTNHHYHIPSQKCAPKSRTGPCPFVQDAIPSTINLPHILLTLDNMDDFFTASAYWEYMPFLSNNSLPVGPPSLPKPSDLSRGSKGRKFPDKTFFIPAK